MYKLNVGQFSGNVGDSFSTHNGYPFSTFDNDNDILTPPDTRNCAELTKGAWWYHGCYESNLNGLNYGTGVSTPVYKGILWEKFSGFSDSLKSDIMAIRPKN